MHEAALALSLMDLVEDIAAREHARTVRVIEVELGALACVELEAFQQAVQSAAIGRIAERAALRVERPHGAARCMACDADVALSERNAPCPGCGSHRLLVSSGDQMRLKAIEVD